MGFATIGSERRVNTTTSGDQSAATAIQLSDGTIVVTWTDGSNVSTGLDIRGIRLAQDGQSSLADDVRFNNATTGNQSQVALASLGNGGFAAAWESSAPWPAGSNHPFDLRNNGESDYVAALTFNALGVASGAEDAFFLGQNGYHAGFDNKVRGHVQFSPALTASMTGGGAAFDLFFNEEVTDDRHIFASGSWANLASGENNFLHVSGNSVTQAVSPVNDETWSTASSLSLIVKETPNDYVPPDDFGDIEAATLTSGATVLAYSRAGLAQDGVFIDFGGNGSAVRVGSVEASNPDCAALPDGGAVAVWQDTRGSSDLFHDIRLQLFNADGSERGGEISVTQTVLNQVNSSVAVLADGRFLVAWTDESGTGGDGSGKSIKAQMFSADGEKSGSEFLLNTVTAGDQANAHVLALQNGTFFVTWTDQGGSTYDIKSIVIDPTSYDGTESDETVYGGDEDDTFFGLGGRDVLLGKRALMS